MNRLTITFAKNFFPIFKRSCILLFKSQNRAIVDVTELNRGQKNGKSVLNLKTDLSNILFLKIDEDYFPIFHDKVSLKLTIPLEPKKEKVTIKGIGLFKTSRTSIIEVSDVKRLTLKSINFDTSGEFKTPVKNINELHVRNFGMPNLTEKTITLYSKNIEVNVSAHSIILNASRIKSPDIHSINLREDDLLLELNSTI